MSKSPIKRWPAEDRPREKLFKKGASHLTDAEISIGSLTLNIVHPREVFNPAIKSSAASIILIHNHPSGDPKPRSEDKVLTKRIKEAGKLLGIPVPDHIIMGGGRYFSFLDEGLFNV